MGIRIPSNNDQDTAVKDPTNSCSNDTLDLEHTLEHLSKISHISSLIVLNKGNVAIEPKCKTKFKDDEIEYIKTLHSKPCLKAKKTSFTLASGIFIFYTDFYKDSIRQGTIYLSNLAVTNDLISETRKEETFEFIQFYINSLSKFRYKTSQKEEIVESAIAPTYQQKKGITTHTTSDKNRKLSTTLNAISDGIVMTDANKIITLINKTAEEITGWKAKDVIGLPIDHICLLTNAKTGEKRNSTITEVLKTGKQQKSKKHTILTTKNGEKFYISEASAPIIDKDSNILGVVINFRNETSEYIARERLKKSYIQLRDALEIANAGSFYIDFENDNGLVRTKRQPKALNDLKSNEFTIEDWKTVIVQNDKKNGIRVYEDAINTINNKEAYNWENEYKRTSTIDGSTIWLKIKASILRDKKGKALYVSGVSQDVTDQKENLLKIEKVKKMAIEALCLAKAFMWSLDVKNHPEVLVIESNIYGGFANNRAPVGSKIPLSKLSKSIKEGDSESGKKFEQQLQQLINGEISETDITYAIRDEITNKTFWFKTTASAIKDHENNIISINGISQDITTENEYQRKIELVNKEAQQAFDMAKAATWHVDLNKLDRISCDSPLLNYFKSESKENKNYILLSDFKKSLNKDADFRLHEAIELIEKKQQKYKNKQETFIFNIKKSKINETISFKIFSRTEVNKKGEIIALSGYIQDITDEKTALLNIEKANYRANQALELAKAHTWYIKAEHPYRLYYNSNNKTTFNTYTDKNETYIALEDWAQDLKKSNPETYEIAMDSHRKILNGEQITKSHIYSVEDTKTKQTIWYKIVATPKHDSEGKVYTVNGITQDVTKSYNIQLQLQKEKEYSQMIIDLMPNALSIIDINKGTVFLSQRYTEMLGYTLNDLKGHDTSTILDIIHPDDVKSFVTHTKLTRTKNGDSELTYRTKHKHTGKYLWIREQCRALECHTNGTVKSITCVFTDITERYIQNIKIKENEERIRIANRSIGIGTWEWDLKTGMVISSPKYNEIYGIDPAIKEHLPILQNHVHPDDIEGCTNRMVNHIRGIVDNYRMEFRYKRPNDNHYIWIFSSGKVTERDADGTAKRMIGLSQEITERKEHENKILEYSNRLEQLFENMPQGFVEHELILDAENNPVDIKYLYFNPAFPKMVDLNIEVGKVINEVAPNFYDPKWISKFIEVATSGQPTFFNTYIASTGKYFKVTAYSNRKGHFATIWEDISTRKKIEQEVKYQRDLSRLLTNISTRYVNVKAKDINKAINEALEEIGTYLNAKHAYIFNYAKDKGIAEKTFEWNKHGRIKKGQNIDTIAIEDIKPFVETHGQGKTYIIEDINKIEDEKNKILLQKMDVKSLFSVPIFINDKLIGFFGFNLSKHHLEFKKWELSLFNVFAEILSNILQRVSSEEQIQKQHDYLNTLINSIPDVIFAKDTQGKYTLTNHALETNMNVKAEDFIGNTDYDIFSKEVADTFMEIDKETLSKKASITIHQSNIAGVNKELLFETTKTPIKDKQGKIIGLIGIGRDITVRQKHENYILVTQKRLRAQVSVSEKTIDNVENYLRFCQEQIIKLTNSKLSAFMVYDGGTETLTKIVSSEKKELGLRYNDTIKLQELGVWGQCIKQKKPYIENNNTKKTFIFKNIDKYLTLPVMSEEKVVALVMVANKDTDYTIHDISHLTLMMGEIWKKTQAYRHQEEQQKVHEYIKSLFDDIPISVILMNKKNEKIILANKTTLEMFEIEPHNINTSSSENKQRIHNTLLEELRKTDWHHHLFENKPFEIIKRISREKIWVSATNIISNFFGQENVTLACLYDITKEKELQTSLKKSKIKADEANMAKSIFLANMSHEIRTPMNSIIGFSDILSHKMTDKSMLHYIKSIQTSGKNLLGIINDILDISKIESGKIEIKKENVNLRVLLSDIESTFSLLLVEKNIELIVKIDEDLPLHIELDEMRMRQVIINLIGNAIKFTKKGCIKIIVDVIDEYQNYINLRIQVIDTGIGVADENKAKIFEAFKQVDGQDSRQYEGTGLGLSISSKIVHLFNGKISISSIPNIGSTFTISLPKVKIIKDAVIEETKFIPETVRFKKSKILIADDIVQNIEIIRGYLEMHKNLTLIEASNGQQAIDLYAKEKPDLILMDLRMPKLDGYQTTSIINEKSHNSTPIIALTASAFLGSHNEIARKGFSGYLRKPIEYKNVIKELIRFIPYSIIEKEIEVLELENKPSNDKSSNEAKESLLAIYHNEWQAISVRQSIKDVKIFISALHEFKKKNSIDSVNTYTDELEKALNSFNIRFIKEQTNRFKDLIKDI